MGLPGLVRRGPRAERRAILTHVQDSEAAAGVSGVVEVHEPGAPPRRVEVHDAIELGRECEGILVVDPRVSRRHLRLASRDGRLTVTDLGSANGTAVNGVAITTETQLQQGDTIQAGGVEL